MDESLPRLDDHVHEDTGLSVASRFRISKLFKVLRILTLVLSTLTLILIITNSIILKHAPFWDTYWQRQINRRVIGWFIASVITSLINVRVNVPSLINIVADLTFSVGAIVSMVHWIGKMPYDDCHSRYKWQDKTTIPPHPKCKDWKLVLNIIMGFTAAFGILLATSYVCLLLLRVYEILKTKFWKKSSWSIPTGEITWTIRLNVINEGNERTYGLTAGARSESSDSCGTVHL